jgi:hypothetical protein
LYRGRFLRHARDGHIVLPFGIPKKIFLPFDIGAEADVATVRWRPSLPMEEAMQMGVVRIAALVDFSRTRSFRQRFTIGPVVRWDIDIDRSESRIGRVSEHEVAPFTTGMANLHLESQDGLWVGDVRAEAGTVWHTKGGWEPQVEGQATLERIIIAINDRPIALTAGVSYASAYDETIAKVGARVVLMHRDDKRVNLRPLKEKRVAPPRPAPKVEPIELPPVPEHVPPPAPAEQAPTPIPVEPPPPAEQPPPVEPVVPIAPQIWRI